jgi:outer membrane protein assembly factor BamB
MLNLGTTPDNDAFGAAVVLTGQSTAVTATNLHCSREVGEPTVLGFAGGNSLWYQWTAPRTGRFQVSALSIDFDPILAVYTGNTLSALTLISASDNTGADNAQTGSLCTIDATAGTTYRISVDSKTASAVGQFTLTLVDSQWQATTGSVLTGSPAVAPDGTVYIAADDKSLYAFGPDGTQKWALATGGLMDACSPATASDGTVYAGSGDGYVYAVNADGTVKWKHLMNATTTTSASFSPAIGADGTVYARAGDGYLRALSATDGAELWKASTGSSGASYYGNPVVGSDGTIYQSSDETDHVFYAFNANGTQRWTATLDSGVYGAPAIDSAGNLYLATLTGGVYSYTAAGTQRWHATSADNVSSSIALSADEKTFYYAGYDAKLYARDTASGTVKWTFPVGKEVRASSPAIDANGVIYVGCYDNKVYAINADGTANRTYDTGNWVRSSPAISGKRMYVGSNDQKLYAFDLPAGPSAGTWSQYRANARRLGRAISEVPTLATQPIAQTVGLGYSFTLTAAASSAGSVTYQWYKDGTAITGATAASYSVSSATTASAGSYTVKVSSAQGSVTSSAANVAVTNTAPGRLMNVSVRTDAGNGDQTLTVGFVLKGSGTKPLVIRGVGPTLATFGVTTALAAPQLVVINQDSKATVASNTIWGGSTEMATAFGSVGAFPLPTNSKDDGLLANLPVNAGGYSVQITGANGTIGNALAEVYDRDSSSATPSARIINVSARAQVGTGGGILIAGFNVSNVSGNAAKLLLIRGVGPTLASFGVGGVLTNPKLEIYDNSTNQLLASNDDWGNAAISKSTFDAVGAFPLNAGSKDAALLISLPPGTYTAQVSGVGSTTGVGLVEVYEVQ